MKRIVLMALLAGATGGALWQGRGCREGAWRGWQKRWQELRRARGLPAEPPGLVSMGEAAERCVSCHLGALPGHAVGGERLFAPHPQVSCGLDRARDGCTCCHRGDPRRLDAGGAHGLKGRADQRLLGLGLRGERRRAALEPGCAGCHRRTGAALAYDAAVVPDVAAGLLLYLGQGCPACHRLPGVATLGEAGPPLAVSAATRSLDELRRRLLRPQAFAPDAPMPPVQLAGPALDRLLLFLAAQAAGAAGRRQPEHPVALTDHFPADYPAEATPAAGALWARRLGCPGCHRLGDQERGVPDLRLVGWYARPEELRATLIEPGRRVPATLMPPLAAPTTVTESILAWLQLQRRPLPSEPAQVAREVCAPCHGRERDPGVVVLARRPPVVEGGARIPRARFLEAAVRGRPGTAMAPWGRVLPARFLEKLQAPLQRGAR